MTQRAAEAERGGMAAVLESTLERWFTPAARAELPEHPGVAYARRTLLALEPACFADGWRAIAGHDIRERLGEIGVPTTALAGAADSASPLARTREIAEAVAGARLVVLDGPHMMHLERPGRVRRRARGAPAPARRPGEHAAAAAARRRAGRRDHGRRSSRPSAREGRDPIALYRVLAHSPRMLRAYAGLARGLRYEAETPRALRELMILRTAQLTGSEYEWAHHRAMAAANGVPEEKVRGARLLAGRARSSTERERAALRCVEEIHTVALSDEAFAELERAVGAPATVELVLLAAFYEAVARMIQALGLEVEPPYRRYVGEPELHGSSRARDAAPSAIKESGQ